MSSIHSQISRVMRSKEEARVSYNRLSRWYDLIAGSFERKHAHTGLQILDVKPGERVLEIGFGTGHAILALARAVGHAGRVYGMDISEGMCRITRSRIMNAGLLDRVALWCGDAVHLPFNENFVDAIFMSFTLELFDTPEIPLVLEECNRVLRKGGRICVVSLSKKRNGGLMIQLYEWIHLKFPNLIDCRPIFVEASLEGAGFSILKTKELSMFGLGLEIVLGRAK